jgi:hypothetical protein
MNIKQLVRLVFQASIVMSLLIANTSIAAAGGGKGGGDPIIGQVSNSVSNSLPVPTAKELGALGITPDASQPIPSGGTAIATAQLSWTAVTMYGKGISSLSSDTVGTLSICATATQLYMNSSPQGGAAQVCAAKTGGGSVTSTKSKTVVSVFGKTWRVDTSHGFSKTGYSWYPSLTVSVSL